MKKKKLSSFFKNVINTKYGKNYLKKEEEEEKTLVYKYSLVTFLKKKKKKTQRVTH